MFIELREYRAKPGQRDNLVKVMEDEVIPLNVSKGMTVLGSFVGEEEDDLYIWMRRFESEEARERLYNAVYESDTWKNGVAARVRGFMDRDRTVIRRIESTPVSAIQ